MIRLNDTNIFLNSNTNSYFINLDMFNIGMVMPIRLGNICVWAFLQLWILICMEFLSMEMISVVLSMMSLQNYVPDGNNLVLYIHLLEITMVMYMLHKNPMYLSNILMFYHQLLRLLMSGILNLKTFYYILIKFDFIYSIEKYLISIIRY